MLHLKGATLRYAPREEWMFSSLSEAPRRGALRRPRTLSRPLVVSGKVEADRFDLAGLDQILSGLSGQHQAGDLCQHGSDLGICRRASSSA